MKKLVLFVFLALSSSTFAEDIYRLKATIGDHVFYDILTYNGCSYSEVKGSLTVPGIFSSKLENIKCSYKWSGEYLGFDIKARENNEEYYVSYSLFISGNGDYISGTMKKDGEIIGTIEGNLIFRGNQ